LLDGRKPELDLSILEKRKFRKMISGTEIEQLLKEHNII